MLRARRRTREGAVKPFGLINSKLREKNKKKEKKTPKNGEERKEKIERMKERERIKKILVLHVLYP